MFEFDVKRAAQMTVVILGAAAAFWAFGGKREVGSLAGIGAFLAVVTAVFAMKQRKD